jgi:hypothetical protein
MKNLQGITYFLNGLRTDRVVVLISCRFYTVKKIILSDGGLRFLIG